MTHSYIRTFTGKLVDLFNMKEEDIDINDIAKSLSSQNRYGGHASGDWSVAQHLLLCTMIASILEYTEEEMIHVFLHDTEETWFQDIIHPVKSVFLTPEYREKAEIARNLVYKHLDIDLPSEDDIKRVHDVDMIAYAFEKSSLFDYSEETKTQLEKDFDAQYKPQFDLIREKAFKYIPLDLFEMKQEKVAELLYQLMYSIKEKNSLLLSK